MYKITNEGTYSLPFNKDTNFYVDGHWHYTIIDVASYNGSVYALLESNTCGEEDMMVVELPQSNIKLLRLYDEGMMFERNMNISTAKCSFNIIIKGDKQHE